MEAEYIGLFHTSQQAVWVAQFMAQIGLALDYPINIYCDSKAAIATAEAENPHKLSKHLDVKLHSIREQIAQRTIWVQSVSTAENTADLLTKSLPIVVFRKHYSCHERRVL